MPTRLMRLVLFVLPALAVAPRAGAQAPAPSTPPPAPSRQLDIGHVADRVLTGDFDAMLERRMIRFVVPFSRTLYFNDKGRERGVTADTVRDFERWINKKYAAKLGKRPITVAVIPTTRDQLLESVKTGRADVAAGNLTVTDERLAVVDFVAPPELSKPVSEVLVTGPKSPPVAALDDLAGKTIHVRPSSSYHESVVALSERFAKAGKPAIRIVPLPDELEDEDAMEMLNAGLLQLLVVDDWKAAMWAQVLPSIKVRSDVVLRSGVRVGWAIRKDSPRLRAELEDFYRNFLRKQGVGPARLKQYMSRVKQIKDPTGSAEARRFQETVALFERYGQQYGFDPLMLAAQGFQESGLKQDAKSHVGAVGVMQLMPATGAELKVGDIRQLEPNIHAGTKYMDQLMTRYFKDADFDGPNRSLFAFAAYNAGPGRIAQMRAEAAKRGLNPDAWFNNVELVTAEKVGIETTTYVRNIYKYYVAYKLTEAMQRQQEKVKQQVKPAP
ncbi:MAG: transglycosylase SLT domain-containing protein [Acidobacteria bacterium]|nr:transglycosylase SLT domain-containing protein [Acidobacteriota bacterium]